MNIPRLLYKNIPLRVLLVLVLSALVITSAIAQQKGKKPPLEEKPKSGSVSHTVNTGSGQKNRQERSNTGSVGHEVRTERNNPPPVYTPPVETRRNDDDNNTSRRNKPSADPVLVPVIVDPVPNTRNEQKPILIITNPDSQRNERNRRPEYRDGRYHYSSRPDYTPSHYGYWVFDDDGDFCKSIYYPYGNFPYIDRMRVHVVHYDVVDFNTKYINSDSDEYYLAGRANNDLDYALLDIRKAWLDGRSDLIGNHIKDDQMIAVLLDSKYDYSIEPEDYSQMTFDAIDQTRTVRFTWESIRQRSNGDYTAFAKHTYRDSEDSEKVVYVSYTLKKINRNYYVVEVGSSKQPLN